MSLQPIAKAIARLRNVAAWAAWNQWGAIFTFSAGNEPARAIVDPEALLLGSFALSEYEPRLWHVAHLWAKYGARLLSVQRVKNLTPTFPPSVREDLGDFAQSALTDAGDLRWRSIAHPSSKARPARRYEPEATPVFEGPAALMLRLRLGFGVGIKPDVMSLLLGLGGERATVQQIATATAYYGRAVRRALEELFAAGFLEARPTAPVSYRIDLHKWAEVLAISPTKPPRWRSWAAVYAFLAGLEMWWRRAAKRSAFVLASEARDLVAAHAEALEPVGIRLPAVDAHRGEAYLGPFAGALKECAEFLEAFV